MDACCEKMMADHGAEHAAEGEFDTAVSLSTCICGSTWEFTKGAWKFYQRERKCLVCGHWSCPCCGDYCDSTVDGEDGEIDMCPCDGTCTYAEVPPEVVRIGDAS